jgi:hypothetical protein
MHKDEFSELVFPRKQLADGDNSRYRVYSTAKEFKVVHAKTAAEALKVSGVAKAWRIRREVLAEAYVIKQDTLAEMGRKLEEGTVVPPPPDEVEIIEKAVPLIEEKTEELAEEITVHAAPSVALPPPNPPPADLPAAPSATAPPVLPDVTLSPDDVNKLLNNK